MQQSVPTSSQSLTVPSHDGMVSDMAAHHAHRGSETQSAIATDAANNLELPRVPSHDKLVMKKADHHAHLGNSTPLIIVTDTDGSSQPPSILSDDELVTDKAHNHAHLGNSTLPPNIADADENSQPLKTPSHDALVGYIVDHHAHLGNSSQQTNATDVANGTGTGAADTRDPGITTNQRDAIIGGVLLSLFFVAFLAIVTIDLRKKHRAGELQEDMRGIKRVFFLVFKAIPLLIRALFNKIVSLVTCKRAKSGQTDVEAASENKRVSQSTIDRLAANTPSLGTTISVPSLDNVFETRQ